MKKTIIFLVILGALFVCIFRSAHVNSLEAKRLWAEAPGDAKYKGVRGVWDIDSHTSTFAIVGKDGSIAYWDTEVPFDLKTGEVYR